MTGVQTCALPIYQRACCALKTSRVLQEALWSLNKLFIFLLLNFIVSFYDESFAAQPSFNCANASLPDEDAICSDDLLAKLDSIANNGYMYLRDSLGPDQANSLDLPIIKKRQACQTDKNCILAVQVESINLFKSYGAPISAPRIKNMRPYPKYTANSDVQETVTNDAIAEARRQAAQEVLQAQKSINEIKQKAQEEIESARRDGAIEERNRLKDFEDSNKKTNQQELQSDSNEEQKKQKEREESRNEKLLGIGFIILIIFGIFIYFIPTIIALKRDHEYKWVIFALNFVGGLTGILWIVALVWAVYPDNRSIADPVLGNVTGKGVRNFGDQLGEYQFGKERGYSTEKQKNPNVMAVSGLESELAALEKLHNLKVSGAITELEFKKKRDEILGHV